MVLAGLKRSRMLRLMFPMHFSRLGSSGSGAVAAQKVKVASTADREHEEKIQRIVRMLESSPESSQQVLEKISPNTRRHLLVVAAAREWYGSDQVHKQLAVADKDNDTKISSADFDTWVEGAVGSKVKLSWYTLVSVAVHAALPFVAFGFLDNSTMILAGDAIDEMFGERLGLSVMGAAALGGVVSGAVGIQIHGLAQRAVQRIAIIPQPNVSAALRTHRSYFRADHLGGTFGIFLGLMLGMSPLLFVDTKPRHA